MLLGDAACLVRGDLRGERRSLSAALEVHVAGTRPAQRVARRIGDRDDGVVEGRMDMRDSHRNVLPFLLLALLYLLSCHLVIGLWLFVVGCWLITNNQQLITSWPSSSRRPSSACP